MSGISLDNPLSFISPVAAIFPRAFTLPSGMNSVSDIMGTGGPIPDRGPIAAPAGKMRSEILAEQEAKRSEQDRLSAIQKQLAQETVFRSRGYGMRSLLGPLGGGRSFYLGSG